MEYQHYDKKSVESIFQYAKKMIDRCLRDILPMSAIEKTSETISQYQKRRKGHFGDLVEKYVFNISPGSSASPDFPDVSLELKTTPLKKSSKKKFVSKERLVLSMIDYMRLVDEEWASSSFLKKNRLLLLMFYLFEPEISLLDYRFKIVKLIDLLDSIPSADVYQIKSDWEFIVKKVDRGEAHLLSEGDTYYLGACTKSSSALKRRSQPKSNIPAKPRAFCLKQSYLNHLISHELGMSKPGESLLKGENDTVESFVMKKFKSYMGLSVCDLEERFDIKYIKRPKNALRLIANRILGVRSNKIAELEKADVTMRVLCISKNGALKESISFPVFDYFSFNDQEWEDSDFYKQLNSRRFLFVVFRKRCAKTIILEKVFFWNFPVIDLDEAKKVWEHTKICVINGRFGDLPKISENTVAHVRPHGRDKKDTVDTPIGEKQVKRCFWLNAKYIQKKIAVS
jgi:DNA mismatch repair protein MutH